MSMCPDCDATLKRPYSRCICGWVKPSDKAPAPKQSAIPYTPPDPPTPEEREYAAKCFAAIRQLANKLRVDYTAKRQAQPMTVAEKIMTCKHEAKSEPFSASRFGAGGHARRCLACGKVDLVQLTAEGIAAMRDAEAERAAMRES